MLRWVKIVELSTCTSKMVFVFVCGEMQVCVHKEWPGRIEDKECRQR